MMEGKESVPYSKPTAGAIPGTPPLCSLDTRDAAESHFSELSCNEVQIFVDCDSSVFSISIFPD